MGVSSFSPASAVKGVNQRVTWFTPFFAPKKYWSEYLTQQLRWFYAFQCLSRVYLAGGMYHLLFGLS